MLGNSYKFIVGLALLVLIAVATLSYLADYREQGNLIGEVCFNSSCIERFVEVFSGSIKVLSEGLAMLALFAAIFGSIVALDSYLISVHSSALANHINHLRLFKDYVEAESRKLGFDGTQNFDVFLWYRIMFPSSRVGKLKVSKNYKTLIHSIEHEADRSHHSLVAPNIKEKYTFTHGDHQRRMREALLKIGIDLAWKQPKDFIEMESKAFHLIDSVNMTFSASDAEDKKLGQLYCKRSYH